MCVQLLKLLLLTCNHKFDFIGQLEASTRKRPAASSASVKDTSPKASKKARGTAPAAPQAAGQEENQVLALLPPELSPEGRMRAGAKSYTVNFEGYKICVNLAKSSYWVYSDFEVPRRNFGWSSSTPAATWELVKNMLNQVARE
jgi:hypothetical protein